MWSWQFISEHRKTCKTYKDTYKKKLSSKKVSADVTATLEVSNKIHPTCVFNAAVIR